MLHDNKIMLSFANGNLVHLLQQDTKIDLLTRIKPNAYRNTLTLKQKSK